MPGVLCNTPLLMAKSADAEMATSLNRRQSAALMAVIARHHQGFGIGDQNYFSIEVPGRKPSSGDEFVAPWRRNILRHAMIFVMASASGRRRHEKRHRAASV